LNKFVVLLIIATITVSGISGLLYYQINDVQNQLTDLQTSNNDLQNQVDGLLTENSELKNEIAELEVQKNELDEQLSNVIKLVKITEFKVNGFQPLGGLLISTFF